MVGKSMVKVINFIATLLVNETGSEIYEKLVEKQKIKKILKKDKKNIERIFFAQDGTDLYYLVEEFIIFSAFINPVFYSPISLSEEQEEKLWKEFQEYLEKEEGIKGFELNNNYKEKIVRCVNLHNEAINSLMDEKSKIHIKKMQKEHEGIEKLLYRIINTLDTKTNLLESDEKLDFYIKQIEALMKSYRFDIGQLRKLQYLCVFGTLLVILIMAISVPMSLQYIDNINDMCILYTLFLFFGIIFGMFWVHVANKLKRIESFMENQRQNLFQYFTSQCTFVLDIRYNKFSEEQKFFYKDTYVRLLKEIELLYLTLNNEKNNEVSIAFKELNYEIMQNLDHKLNIISEYLGDEYIKEARERLRGCKIKWSLLECMK